MDGRRGAEPGRGRADNRARLGMRTGGGGRAGLKEPSCGDRRQRGSRRDELGRPPFTLPASVSLSLLPSSPLLVSPPAGRVSTVHSPRSSPPRCRALLAPTPWASPGPWCAAEPSNMHAATHRPARCCCRLLALLSYQYYCCVPQFLPRSRSITKLKPAC